MLKKHKQFIRVFAIFLVLVIFANIVIPNISFASSYDDLKALVTEIENDQTLASTVYTNFLYSKDPRPTKEVYGDEYVDAMTKWLAVALIPEKDRSTKIKNALIESEPYLNENLKAEDIDDTYYLNAYNEIKKTKDTYDKAKDEGKSDIDASNEAGKDLNDTVKSYAEGMYKADKELGRLYNYIQTLDEETIIVFFGDHLPLLKTQKLVI